METDVICARNTRKTRSLSRFAIWDSTVDISYVIQDLLMFAIRSIAFRLHESPRFLVANGRRDECARVLNKIAHVNGLMDFIPSVACEGSLRKISQGAASDHVAILDTTVSDVSPTKIVTPPPHSRMTSSARLEPRQSNLYGHEYSSDLSASLPAKKGRSSFFTPSEELESIDWNVGDKSSTARHSSDGLAEDSPDADLDSEDGHATRDNESLSRRDHLMNSLDEWANRFGSLFQVQWWRTTILMIYIWMSMALAYGMSVQVVPASG